MTSDLKQVASTFYDAMTSGDVTELSESIQTNSRRAVSGSTHSYDRGDRDGPQ
ncbi:hypothetical protein M2275_006240 [Rhodococcus opacus]|nr:hypothetical protein [Rhodococcus opacus]